VRHLYRILPDFFNQRSGHNAMQVIRSHLSVDVIRQLRIETPTRFPHIFVREAGKAQGKIVVDGKNLSLAIIFGPAFLLMTLLWPALHQNFLSLTIFVFGPGPAYLVKKLISERNIEFVAKAAIVIPPLGVTALKLFHWIIKDRDDLTRYIVVR